MIKRRFGEEFHTAIAERLEVKQVEARKPDDNTKKRVVKGGKRQPR